MTDECAQAISVANCYFVLVDGMVPGFKDHLADHVVLKWFRKVITGKENVAAFMLSNKMESFHTFSDITPISGISCASKQSNRKIKQSYDQNANCETYTSNYLRKPLACSSHETEMSTTHNENVIDCNQKNDVTSVHEAACNKYEFHIETCINKLRISRDMNVDIDVNQNELGANAIADVDDQSHGLNKSDLYNLFEPEITSQPIVGKIQNINRIKLKEEMAPTITAVNRECDQGDGPVIAEANTTKYLEANGVIKFVQLNTQTDFPFLCHWSKQKKKLRKRQCKLQIAYSLLIDNDSSKTTKKCNVQKEARCAHVSNFSAEVRHDVDKIPKSKLPSLKEAIQASNTLIRDVNHFGGYLQPLNFSEDREDFLKDFDAERAQKNPNVHCCAHYVNNKLIFDFPSKKPFNVMYKIHEIVYLAVKKNASNTQETADAK